MKAVPHRGGGMFEGGNQAQSLLGGSCQVPGHPRGLLWLLQQFPGPTLGRAHTGVSRGSSETFSWHHRSAFVPVGALDRMAPSEPAEGHHDLWR